MTSVQPIDKGAIKFKLIFHNTNKEYWIDPPIGWDKMPIVIKRGDKYSRQIKFGEEQEVEFWAHKPVRLGHQFEVMKLHHSIYGDECYIELVIFVDDEVFMRAELDFKSVITDKYNFFKTKLIVNDLNKIVDDLEDTKVNVFGDESLKGNYNEPAIAENVILTPKKIRERAVHLMGDADLKVSEVPLIKNFGGNHQQRPDILIGNSWGALQVDESDVASAYYVPPNQSYINANPGNLVPTTYTEGDLKSTQNLYFEVETNLVLQVKNVHIKVEGQNLTNQGTQIRLQIAKITYDNAELENVINKEYINLSTTTGKEVVINASLELTIPRFTRLIYEYRVNINTRLSTPDETLTIYPGAQFIADTVGIYPPTGAKMSRLIHVGHKILSNYSEGQSQIIAPRFYEGGEFWWYYITSGSFIRGFTESSFDLSFKDWKEFIQNAFNCDVQINGNTVFIGKQEDFYIDKEIARFPFKPGIDSYEISFNEDLIVNNLKISYENFEDDKKETLDAFHTESEWYIPKRNKGELGIEIGFTADGYSIEYARREGIEAEPTTAKQKDDDVYIVDCFINKIFVPPVPPFIEGGFFDILQNRQNQGFPVVNNIFSPESAYNLRLSLKRLLVDHYPHRIAEIGQKLNNGIPSNDTVYLKNTYFKSNGDLQTLSSSEIQTFNSLLTDNEPVTLNELRQPLILNEIYSFKLSMRLKYNELISLYNRVINERGYVSMTDKEKIFKFYPFDMSYDWVKEELTFKAERKYEI